MLIQLTMSKKLLISLLLIIYCQCGFYLHTKFDDGSTLNSVYFSPDVSMVAFASTSNTHKVYYFPGMTLAHLYSATVPSTCAKFSPDRLYVAFALNNYNVVIKHTSDFSISATIPSKFNSIQQIDFSHDSSKLILCGKNSTHQGYEIWATPSPGTTPLKDDYTYISSSLACRFASDGSYAVGDIGGNTHYYSNTYNLQWKNTLTSGSGTPAIESVAFAPNASLLAVGTSILQRVQIFSNLASNSAVSVIQRNDPIISLDFTDDGLYLATGQENGEIFIFNTINSYSNVFNKDTGSANIYSLDFSTDSCWLTASVNNFAYFYYNCTKEDPISPPIRCPIQQYLNSSKVCRVCALDMIGCRKCNTSTVCQVCTDMYYLNSSNKCSPCTAINRACVSCTNSTVCTQCAVNYYLNGANCSLCFSALKGCTTCLDASTCLSCSRNYYFNSANDDCLPCSYSIPSCLTCNSSSVCVSCTKSYFIDVTANCSKCDSNCSSCVTNSTNCLSCDNGFYLSGSSCLDCLQNCVLCSASNSCDMCVSGYYLSASKCLPCSSKCESCTTSASMCLSCNNGYFLSGNTCTLCNTNCASCHNSASYCLSCNIGYYINNTSHTCVSCTSVDPKCLLCDSSTCYSCASGSVLNGAVCESCATAIPGCQLCNTTSNCLVCSSEYYLSGSSCTRCVWPCVSCTNSSVCLGCALGYYFNSSTSNCLKCSCPTCTSSTQCLSCVTGEYLSSGSCLSCSSIHPMCRSCKNSSHCVECGSAYYLSASNCSLCPLGCSSCTDSTICKTCSLGYYLQSTSCILCPSFCSTCLSATTCSECVDGYYLSASNKCEECSSLLSGCDSCNSTVCWSCSFIAGYFMSANQCYSCSANISHCQRCTDNNFCVECEPSYALNNSNSSCVACSSFIPFCQSCTNSSHCDRCLSGYYSAGTSCLACISGCFTCNSSSTCEKCFPQFWLTASLICTECASALLGCNRCSSLLTCTDCGFGYYLSGSVCLPCLAAMSGCLSCNVSNICLSCQSGYYLNSSSNTCLLCNASLSGCGLCSSSGSCDVCLGGYYLNSGQCLLCATPNCMTCSSSQCYQCESGFYLNGSVCSSCASLFSGCLMCNSSSCHTCKTGYYSTGSTCSKCVSIGCEVCNNTNPAQCLGCSSTYYLNSGSCSLCQTVLSDCIQCDSAGTSCSVCRAGYYINGGSCALCSVAMPNCLSCSSNSICKACDSGSLLVATSCTLCKALMDGCLFCQSSTSCSNCMQGYFLNSSSLCQRCAEIEGCLICRNLNSCNLCTTGYFLESGVCYPCNSTMQGCIACSSNVTCLACEGNYSLTVSNCIAIQSTVSYYPYEELKLKSVYVNATTLKHTLWILGNTFRYTDMDLILHSNLSYVTTAGQVFVLTITAFQWGGRNTSIIFYTKNTFELSQSLLRMKFFDKRLLSQENLNKYFIEQQLKVSQRLMQTQYPTNLQLNANFQLTMEEQAVLSILPYSFHGGQLYLNYNANQPEFLASTLTVFDFKFHYFGQVVSVCLLVLYIVKGIVLDEKGTDKGQLSAHILLLKTPVLMLYPTYAQLVDYCGGFMLADLPWFNNYFASILSEPRDISPKPYLMFYSSLSISSMYLLPVIFLMVSFVLLKTVSYLKPKSKATTKNLLSVLYSFFLGGLSFAAAACVQGAILNPIDNELTVSSFFYLLGLVIFLNMVAEAVWSTCRAKHNFFKIRVIVKSVLLSIMHYNAINLFPLVMVCEVGFMVIKVKLFKLKEPKLWVVANIMPNLALLLLVQLSHSLISIYLSAVLIVITLLLEVIIMIKEFRLNRVINDVKISSPEIDASVMKMLEIFHERQDNIMVSTLFTQQNETSKKQQNENRDQKQGNKQIQLDTSQQQYFLSIEDLIM